MPTKPSQNTPPARSADRTVVDVVGAVIRDGDRVLLAQRPEGKAQAGLWEFPGGKIEPGETPEEALARECREELALEIERPSDRKASPWTGSIRPNWTAFRSARRIGSCFRSFSLDDPRSRGWLRRRAARIVMAAVPAVTLLQIFQPNDAINREDVSYLLLGVWAFQVRFDHPNECRYRHCASVDFRFSGDLGQSVFNMRVEAARNV